MQTTIDDLTLMNYVDRGGFAEIYLSKKKGINEILATKRLDQSKLNETPILRNYLENEIVILNTIKHPNIIRLYDVKYKPDYIYLVMEYCNGGSLHNCLQNYMHKYHKPFTEEIVQYLMRQILSGLKCLHDHQVIHRDLKLANILIKYKSDADAKNGNIFCGHVKIIDFNTSTKPGSTVAKTAVGTVPNMAPSVIYNLSGGRDDYDEKVDIWSLGTLCYEMLVGKPLFDGNKIIEQIKECNIDIPKNISNEAQSFLRCMLQKEGENRWSVNDLLKHKFITNNAKDFTYTNHNYNPNYPNQNNNHHNQNNHHNHNNYNQNNNPNYNQNNYNNNYNNHSYNNYNPNNNNHNNNYNQNNMNNTNYNNNNQYRSQPQYNNSNQHQSHPQYNNCNQYQNPSQYNQNPNQPQYNNSNQYQNQPQYNNNNQYQNQPQYNNSNQYQNQPQYNDSNQYQNQPQYNYSNQYPNQPQYNYPNQSNINSQNYKRYNTTDYNYYNNTTRPQTNNINYTNQISQPIPSYSNINTYPQNMNIEIKEKKTKKNKKRKKHRKKSSSSSESSSSDSSSSSS